MGPVDVDARDLGSGSSLRELDEADRQAACLDREGLHAEAQRDVSRLREVLRAIGIGGSLFVPGEAQVLGRVVIDRLGSKVRRVRVRVRVRVRRRPGSLVTHPDEPLGLPAVCLELGPQRLADVSEIELQATVPEAGEAGVGNGRQLFDARRRVAFDRHDVLYS